MPRYSDSEEEDDFVRLSLSLSLSPILRSDFF